jgi:hypothetical protein
MQSWWSVLREVDEVVVVLYLVREVVSGRRGERCRGIDLERRKKKRKGPRKR